MPTTCYIQDEDHYQQVLKRIRDVRQTLWIGTADIKDLFIQYGKTAVPFLKEVAALVEQGVQVRLIHAKEPGPMFRADFDRFPCLVSGLERILCPRVHFKMMIFDLESAYIGSANLTGAGMGMKSGRRRNFEAGILTDEPSLVQSAMEQFDCVWMGIHCEECDRKSFCGDQINS